VSTYYVGTRDYQAVVIGGDSEWEGAEVHMHTYTCSTVFIVWGSIPLCEYSIMECKNRLPQLLLYLVSK
jgi:hypothetical protein